MKPLVEAPIIGADSNIFSILGIASKALKREGYTRETEQMQVRVMASPNYNKALSIIMEYVEPVSEMEYDGQSM